MGSRAGAQRWRPNGEESRLSYDADVIIVGSGLAGLVAAAELADARQAGDRR